MDVKEINRLTEPVINSNSSLAVDTPGGTFRIELLCVQPKLGDPCKVSTTCTTSDCYHIFLMTRLSSAEFCKNTPADRPKSLDNCWNTFMTCGGGANPLLFLRMVTLLAACATIIPNTAITCRDCMIPLPGMSPGGVTSGPGPEPIFLILCEGSFHDLLDSHFMTESYVSRTAVQWTITLLILDRMLRYIHTQLTDV